MPGTSHGSTPRHPACMTNFTDSDSDSGPGSESESDIRFPSRLRPGRPPHDPYLQWLEGALEEGKADLRERVRELSCLFAVDRALRRGDEEWRVSLQEVADALPSGFHTTPPAGARIRLGTEEVTTGGFRSSPWKLTRRIVADDQELGEVEVVRSGTPEGDDVSFSPEEASLLESVADRLAEAMGRILAEENLRQGEAFQKALIRSSPVPLFSIDTEGLVVMWNPAAERVFGWSSEEICGNPLPILSEADVDAYAEMRGRAAAGETLAGVHFTCHRHDGTPVAVLLSIAPVRLPFGDAQPRAILFAVEDFEDEGGTWRTNRFQARLLESVGQAVIATGLDGRITHWNRAAASIYGWNSPEVLGRDILNLIPADSARPEAAAIMDVLRAGERWTGQMDVRHQDGSTFPAFVTNAPIHDEHDRLVGVVGVSTDVSRVRDLEAQLRQSQKMEALGGLAGGIAHDFNNLLTVIQGHTEMIAQDLPPNSPLKEDMQEIIAATHRATRLTRPLLALSRRQVMEERLLDLGESLANIEPLLRRLIPSRIDVKVDLGVEPGTVHADPSQVDQVIMNLVVNAVDAVQGVGEIELGVDRCTVTPESSVNGPWEAAPGSYARFRVTDTGEGMTPEVAGRIFEPFFTTKAPGQGTGLGLSTVFGIVKQGRGHILVNSEPGEGTTFEILWPLVEAPDGAQSPDGERAGERAGEAVPPRSGNGPEPSASPGPTPGPGPDPSPDPGAAHAATVLVVDDDPGFRGVVQRTLERAGYRVLAATNGREAVDILAEHPGDIQLVLSDVVMPLMGGSDLLKHLGEASPGIPVILATGYADREISEDVRRRASAFLRKPFGARDLLRVVEEALDD
ncbi:MAG: PAS domain-containing sensor histidine kinase [Gemmatimonadales bacterium]|nr:MAG: PAS domain-containing sensor histidine kinase [Gemmatimonadales bacterium]